MKDIVVGLLRPEEREELVELAVTSGHFQSSQDEDEIKHLELMAPTLRTKIPNILSQDGVVCFVARETDKSGIVGFLILNTQAQHGGTGESESFIVDLFVKPEYWGGKAVQLIIQKAAEYTHCMGIKRMAGEISVHNQRAYIKALRLGFTLDRLKITSLCGPEGIETESEVKTGESVYSESRKGKKSSSIGLPGSWKQYRTWRVTHRPK